MAEPQREQLKHVIVVEEAHHIFSRLKQEIEGKETVTEIILREIRELGECFIVVDQHPALLSRPALGNTYTTLCMNLKQRSDINEVCGIVGFHGQEKEKLSHIDLGESVVRLQGRISDSFMVKIPLVPVQKGIVSDFALKQRMQPFSDYFEENQSIPREITPLTKEDRDEHEEKSSNKEIQVLKDILDNPVSRVRERFERFADSKV